MSWARWKAPSGSGDTMSFELPSRSGPRPTTTDCAPHEQVTQNSPPEIHAEFKRRAFELPFVERRLSGISVPGAEALAGRIAFDPRLVEITETPPGAGG